MSLGARGVLGVLVAATIGAFFVTQHLKSTTPVLTGNPFPLPSAISPGQRACGGRFARTSISFYLLHRADDVSVYVVDSTGSIVRTLASGRHMRRGVRNPDGNYTWDGRGDDHQVVPDGVYAFRVALLHQNRTIDLRSAVTVETVAPHPVVRNVTADGRSPAILPAVGGATIAYAGDRGHAATVQLYRTDLPGPPRPVTSLLSRHSPAHWDGRAAGRPAPAGIYLVGLSVTDRACNTGRFPPQLPPVPGSTTGAGLTIRNLAVLPPLDPVPGGGEARVLIDARHHPYRWALRLRDATHTVALGTGSGPVLRIRVPHYAAFYELAVTTADARVEVPIVVSAAAHRYGRVLIVVPTLTWEALVVSDARRDGVATTLDGGGPLALSRPFTGRLPAGAEGIIALLSFLDRARLPYDLTTDLGLVDGAGPGLTGNRGVVLAGTERWAPSSLTRPLVAYVRRGGRVLVLGPDSLRRTVALAPGVGGPVAENPSPPSPSDALGGLIGAPVAPSGLVLAGSDALHLFDSTSGALPGVGGYIPVTGTVPPAGPILSRAGVSTSAAAIAGWRIGSGIVAESGLPALELALGRSVDAQEFVKRLWAILLKR